MPSVLHKFAPYRNQGQFLNTANLNDATIGGTITSSPANYQGSALQQNYPGDRIIFDPATANAASNNNVGNLYEGSYRYVAMRNNSTSNPIRGRAAFWDPTGGGLTGNNIGAYATDALYMVTSDGNSANYTNTLFAGVYVNNITLSNGTPSFWWIQESGKANLHFINATTGTPAIGSPVFLPLTPAANNNATDNGSFDVLVGANSSTIFQANSTTAYTTIGQMIQNYVGISEIAASNNNYSLVNMTWQRASLRF
jgi:hypothetical protein